MSETTAEIAQTTTFDDTAVWLAAFAPIAFAVIDRAMLSAAADSPLAAHPLIEMADRWLLPLSGAAMCLLDLRQLGRAGRADRWLLLAAVSATPVYLVLRARRLGRRPTSALAWLASFLAMLAWPLLG